jgi:transposase
MSYCDGQAYLRELLPAAPVLYADETPCQVAGKLRYVHVACTEFLTAMHTGDRTSQAIDADGIQVPGGLTHEYYVAA